MTDRQHAVAERLRRRIEASPFFECAFLLGSLARMEGDEMSDVDVFVVVKDGEFSRAWTARDELEGGEALVAWDDVEPETEEVAGHKWLTHDLVLVECLLTTSGRARLADPFAVLAGDPSLADRVPRRPPIPRPDLAEYAQMRIETGRAHPVEIAYGELTKAVRAFRRAVTP